MAPVKPVAEIYFTEGAVEVNDGEEGSSTPTTVPGAASTPAAAIETGAKVPSWGLIVAGVFVVLFVLFVVLRK